MSLKKYREKKAKQISAESEWMALRENEEEANRYAAKCLTVCAGVGATAWLFNLLGIFIIPPHDYEYRHAVHHPVFPDSVPAIQNHKRYACLGKVR